MEVYISPNGKKFIWELLLEKGITLASPCGGNGKCGKCKVKILSGETVPPSDSHGFVLACKTIPLSECVILLNYNENIIDESQNLNLSNSCFNSQNVDFYNSNFQNPSFENSKLNNAYQDNSFDNEKKYEYAVCDVGTTNVKLQKFTKDGVSEYSSVFRNPQCAYGEDVLSRISFCQKVGFEKLSSVLISSLAEELKDVKKAYICGNPTMIHFTAQVDPTPIGVYPFECVFKETKYIEKSKSGFGCDAVLLPSASGYVGSDAICGIYLMLDKSFSKDCFENKCINNNESDDFSQNKNVLIADLGTNGEISLIKNGKIYSATTAAGPAIEGAGIEMGMCGGDGAIYDVTSTGEPLYRGKSSKGLSGSGLVSLISYLLKNDILSCDGRLNFEKKYYISKDVYITQKDVEAFMLAKSAVKTAIKLLLKNTSTDYESVDLFVLTGGIGKYLNIQAASNVGLFPKELFKKAVYIPDLALSGAYTAVKKCEINIVENISKTIDVISLSEDAEFEEEFVFNTFFNL